MNVNNKLYRLNFNQKPLQPDFKKEEETCEQKEAPSVKAPKAKPVTMNLSDLLAEMNKSMLRGQNVTKAENTDNKEVQGNMYTDVDSNIVEEYIVVNGNNEIDRFSETTVNLQVLKDENNSIWNYVKGLLNRYNIIYENNFANIGDGSSNPANVPIMEPLAQLRNKLLATPEGVDILDKLNERVAKYLEMLVYYHQNFDTGDAEINKNQLKHPMHFGIWVTLCGN